MKKQLSKILIFLFALSWLAGFSQSNVCFNRLYGGYAEIMIPVNQWNDDTVTVKAYGLVGGGQALVPVTLNTASLPKVTSSNGTEYYYIKQAAAAATEDLIFEVSSKKDAAVSYTLPVVPQNEWNNVGTSDACGVAKADVCFNRLHGGYAEIMIPVNQWNDDTVTVKAYGLVGGGQALVPVTFDTATLPKVISSNGTEYYYIKQAAAAATEDLIFEVSSKKDAAVSYTLPVVPQSEWNNFALQNSCINKTGGVCMNRNGANYTIYIPKNNWRGTDVKVKLYHIGGMLMYNQIFTNPTSEIYNGTLCYKLSVNYSSYTGEKVVAEVSSLSNAAFHMLLEPVQQLCNGGTCPNPVTPSFTQLAAICKDDTFSLPVISNEGITGTWNPTINNQTTTTYTFTPDEGQCAGNVSMIVQVNPTTTLSHTSGNLNPTLQLNTPIENIVYVLEGNAGATVTGLPSGVVYHVAGNQLTISGTPTTTGSFNYIIQTVGGCGSTNVSNTMTVNNKSLDWTKAPNSYIFTGKDKMGNNVDGLYIPVKKAYEMWRNGSYMKVTNIPTGPITADVLWEDNMGLIKSKANYALDVVGTGESAEIKVPIDKVKEGNAVIAYKINGEVFWSWHVWVTDDPTNGSTYKSYDDVKRQLSDGTVETIPNSEWGWMDRNLGALGSSLNGDGWHKNGGLMYQWGRKDPFPSLVNTDVSFYQITGSMGKIVYADATGRLKNFPNTPFNDYKSFNDLRKFTNKSTANITDNIRLSVRNPLSLIYVNDDGTENPSIYAPPTDISVAYYYNWFGQVSGLQTDELSKINLWSDNSLGIQAADLSVAQPQPYRNKSSYDPCPNGWRLPSVLVASSSKNLRMDFTPFGPKVTSPLSALNLPESNIPPGLSNLKPYLAGIKVYPQYGFDMTNVGGNNIGIFPGTGWIGRGRSDDKRYHLNRPGHTDQLETYLWTATMTTAEGYSSVASTLRLIPSSDQLIHKPDVTNYPNVYGLYNYKPADDYPTINANACRCIKDPLFVKNEYDFETKFFTETETYKEGLDNPNTYMITRSAVDQVISIPVSKAFSVQSNYLGNTQILNPSSFNALKANVLWTDNPALITQLTIDNPASKDANINVKVNANQAGNAVVTFHNGSISNPVYWSWHIWVTNTAVDSFTHVNDTPINTDNYVNYTQYGTIMKTTIMDRNLGATDVMPFPFNVNVANDVAQLRHSQGLNYQWGRKDPLPIFKYIDDDIKSAAVPPYNIAVGTTNNDGVVTYSNYTEANYNSSDIVNYDTYKSSINAADKIDVRIEKILGYSVANPLKFLMPTIKYPIRTPDHYTLASDWLFDTQYHNLYAERWGMGDKKSVFDPCPAGWRIPEIINNTGKVKTSPWSLKNNDEIRAISSNPYVENNEAGYYGLNIYGSPNSTGGIYGTTVGSEFNNNSLYNIGYYPKSPVRGLRSVMTFDPSNPSNNDINSRISQTNGIWYANLNGEMTGRGIMRYLDGNGRMGIKYSDVDPYAALSCRCVKQEDNGTPRGPLPGIPVTQNTGIQAKNTFTKTTLEEKIKDDKLVLYPVPVKDILNLDAKDDKDYYYQIYNMAGQLVKKGKFSNKQTNTSELSAGTYLVRINNSENVVKIIKN